MSTNTSIFRSAVTGTDGTIDPGYLGLFAVMLIVLGSIPGALVLIGVRMFLLADHPLDLTGLAAVIGAATVGFGGAASGVGLFRMGDKPRPGTTTTDVSASQTIVTPAPAVKGKK